MKTVLGAGAPALLALAAAAVGAEAATVGQSCGKRTNNTIEKLTDCVTVEGVRAHLAALQEIADGNGDTRVSGSPGYDASALYVAETLEAAGYEVTLQPFDYSAFVRFGTSEFRPTDPGAGPYEYLVSFYELEYSGSGPVTGVVEAVDLELGLGNASSSGCEASDFSSFTSGNIALIQRGTCSFAQKAENAAAAGATAVIIFNQGNTADRTDLISATLGEDFSGDIPVIFTTYFVGEQLANATDPVEVFIRTDVETVVSMTMNVIAELPGKNDDNVVMVGAHLDSVEEGPGINDNGSGSAAILETALAMAKVKPVNTVRFAWWGAEEAGLVGATYYVDNLTDEEIDEIALYLNYDMVGSPNYVFFIYDGDDSDQEGAGPGPDGSAQIEKQFEAFYESRGEPYLGTDFSGRSDYGPFIAVGIPSGGLFTGAEGIKTPEQAAIWGGTAGEQYDPCYHAACDTFDNVSLKALDVNADAIAAVTLAYAMNTEEINGVRGKGNFKPETLVYRGPQPQM